MLTTKIMSSFIYFITITLTIFHCIMSIVEIIALCHNNFSDQSQCHYNVSHDILATAISHVVAFLMYYIIFIIEIMETCACSFALITHLSIKRKLAAINFTLFLVWIMSLVHLITFSNSNTCEDNVYINSHYALWNLSLLETNLFYIYILILALLSVAIILMYALTPRVNEAHG